MPVVTAKESIAQAFRFAWSAASQGLSQAAGLRQYREGGGEIRTLEWNRLFRAGFEAVGQREDVRSVPLHWQIPEKLFVKPEAAIDWTSKYNFIAEVKYFNTATQAWETKHIQAGFDELPTHAEWRAEALRRMQQEEASPAFDIERGVSWLTEETLQRWD
jgi:hypothetical protein